MNVFEKSYYEAEAFWQPEVFDNDANRERIMVTSNLVPSDAKSLLDVGCGNGIFVNALKNSRPDLRIVGVDRSEAALKYVEVEKKIGDIAALEFSDSSFDCVSCLEVLEHLPQVTYQNALEELSRIARQYIIISVPFEERLEAGMNRCPRCLSVFNVDLHLRSFNANDLENLLLHHGFRCLDKRLLSKSEEFKGHFTYQKIFFPNYKNKWRSPICPICGFTNDGFAIVGNMETSITPQRRGLISVLKAIPKKFWPKVMRYYWIIALYKRQ